MIEPKLLKLLSKLCNEITYQREECIIYTDHVPKVGFILLEGKLELQMSRSKKILAEGSIVGIKELTTNQPFKHTIKAFPNTKVLTIDKSALKAISKYKAAKEFIESLEDEAS